MMNSHDRFLNKILNSKELQLNDLFYFYEALGKYNGDKILPEHVSLIVNNFDDNFSNFLYYEEYLSALSDMEININMSDILIYLERDIKGKKGKLSFARLMTYLKKYSFTNEQLQLIEEVLRNNKAKIVYEDLNYNKKMKILRTHSKIVEYHDLNYTVAKEKKIREEDEFHDRMFALIDWKEKEDKYPNKLSVSDDEYHRILMMDERKIDSNPFDIDIETNLYTDKGKIKI